MSKIQSSIQKLMDKKKSRPVDSDASERKRGQRSGDSDERASGVSSEIFRNSRAARSDSEIMKESRIVSVLDDPSASAAYDVLRTRILQRMRSNNWHTILVTSAGAGEGKTLTASNLAVSLSRDVNQSVLLVDLDLRRSSVAKYLGFEIDVDAGVGDYLTGNAEIPDIVYVPSEMERIGIIPNREPLENASDLLGSPKMKELLAWLKDQTGQAIVIFDMPPVLAHDDVLAICPEIDSVLMVVAQGNTNREQLEKATDLLQDTNFLGVVLNKSTHTRGSDSYGYY
jgi:capsular exopolysaccharide synthesis family protein